MIEDLQTIYKGKATIINNRQYLSTKAYVEPFVDRFKDITNKFICNVKPAEQISYDSDNTDLVFNKVLITAIFPDSYDFVVKDITYHRVVCMSYNLDVRTPTCKFYTGVMDTNANFYAFGSDCIAIQKLEPEETIDYSVVKTIIENGLKDQCQIMITQLKDIVLTKDNILNTLGEWIDFTIKKEYINDSGKTKLSPSLAIEAYKKLAVDKDSSYYSDLDSFAILDAFRAFEEQIIADNKDINSRYEKTQLINQLLKL